MPGLTSRERVLMAVEHREPDRVPMDFASFQYLISASGPYGYAALCDYLGIKDPVEPIEFLGMVLNPDPRVQERLGNDFATVSMGFPPPEVLGPGRVRLLPYGVLYMSVGPYWYPDFAHAPLKEARTVEEILSYPYWPDPNDPVYTTGVRDRAKWLHENTDKAVVAEVGLSDFFCHLYHWLRGFEQWFVDMRSNPDICDCLMSKLVDGGIELARRFYREVGEYIDVAHVCGDDMGWQQGPFLSPGDYRRFVKPYILRYLEEVRKLTKAKFFYHCDGSVAPLIEEFIDMGFDILSPVSYGSRGMDPRELKKRYGDRIAFHSAVDVQQVMARGTVEDVVRHVTEVVRALAPGGGYIFAIEDIKPETPPAQIVAAFDTAREVGRYPIG